MYRKGDISKDLLSRTQKFSEEIIIIINKLSKNVINRELTKQLIRSGTSIGANYREACEAESGKDFVHKIRISKKESRETQYWLTLLIKTNPQYINDMQMLLNEVTELLKIFSSISSKFKKV